MSYIIKKMIKEYESLHYEEMEKSKDKDLKFYTKSALLLIVTLPSLLFSNTMTKLVVFNYGTYHDIIVTMLLITSFICIIIGMKIIINWLYDGMKRHEKYKLDYGRYYQDFNKLLENVFEIPVIENVEEIIQLIEHEIYIITKLSILRNSFVVLILSYTLKIVIDYFSSYGIENIVLIFTLFFILLLILLSINKMQNASTVNSKRKNLYYIKCDLLELKIMKSHIKNVPCETTLKGRKVTNKGKMN